MDSGYAAKDAAMKPRPKREEAHRLSGCRACTFKAYALAGRGRGRTGAKRWRFQPLVVLVKTHRFGQKQEERDFAIQ